jgi:putative membrane protein
MLTSLLNSSPLAMVVRLDQLYETLITTLIFVVIGLVFFTIAFFVLDKAMPYSVHKEIEEDQNTALGIIIGSMLIGIAIIIAAAIHGG